MDTDLPECCGQGCNPCVLDLYKLKSRPPDLESVDLSLDFFTSFEISSIVPEAQNTNRYMFRLPDDKRLNSRVCQHISVRCQTMTGVVYRPYSIASHPTLGGHFDLVIKTYAEGEMSPCVQNWTVGTYVEMCGPYGDFIYKRNMTPLLLLVAGGTGVVPLLPLVQQIAEDMEEDTIVYLLYSSKSRDDVISKSLLDELQDYWNIHIYYFITNHKESAETLNWRSNDNVSFKRIEGEDLEQRASITMHESLMVVCGSSEFEKEIGELGQAAGFRQCVRL